MSEKVKVVYTDDGKDKAIVGIKKAEDERFLTILDKRNCPRRIAKSRIILIKVMEE